ncbi:RICIN domain-containing protein [Aquimarina sp. MMG016]|uniref:RICIN domain-containing protein n=1 Tax=Aquimarina sp. MMG016 TaxID=2822690 RepID=UPI001B3A7814|nr:RICIN domain-containing protein [Aquimarina sp. MMG016]MBQ4822503.1 RICIN domain-containing protein [Aquimarina sp. MMG016]
MKNFMLFVFVVFCTQIYGQRSQKPWTNSPNYKQDLIEAQKESLNLKHLAKYFEKTNQNNNMDVKNAEKQSSLSGGISFVNGLNLAWIQYGRDVGVDPFFSSNQYHPELNKFGEAMDFVKNQGGNVIRWWYHTNGSTNPVFDNNQTVKPNPSFFHEDVKNILDLAKTKGLKVQICLWSFDMLKDQWGVDASANKKLLTQDYYMNAYINNALLPLVNFIGDHPALFAWEIFNEPEGMTNQYAGHWDGFKERITMSDVQKFVNRTAGAIRRAQPNVKITNGALGFLTNVEDADNGFWNAYSDANLKFQGNDNQGYLDFYNIHYYKWARSKGSPFHNRYDVNKVDKEAIIGEYYPDDLFFGQQGGDNDHNLSTIRAENLGTAIQNNNWAGTLVWSWTDRSSSNERNRIAAIIKNVSDNDTGGDPGVIEEVSFNNALTTIVSKDSYTFDINYSAKTDREIVVEFWASDRWLGEQMEPVSSGTGIKSITVNLPNAPQLGSGYFYKVYIRPVGTTWQEAIYRTEFTGVTVITDINDEVAFVNPDSSIEPKTSYTFNVDYSAKTDREIVVEFWAPDRWLGEQMERVSSGTGTKNVTVNLANPPQPGSGYFYKVYIRPIGTTWQDAITRDEFTGVTVLNDQLITDGTYYITSTQSNQRIISRWREGHSAKMRNPRNNTDQRWVFNHLGDNVYTIKNRSTNRYLEVRNANCSNRADVMSWYSANDDHQKWKIMINESSFTILPIHCQQKALDRDGGLINANVQLWDFNSSNNNQKWNIIPYTSSRIRFSKSDKHEAGEILMYPNPAGESVYLSGLDAGDKIKLYDLLGKMIKEFVAGQHKEMLLISDLEPGYYNILIEGKGQVRLLKE